MRQNSTPRPSTELRESFFRPAPGPILLRGIEHLQANTASLRVALSGNCRRALITSVINTYPNPTMQAATIWDLATGSPELHLSGSALRIDPLTIPDSVADYEFFAGRVNSLSREDANTFFEKNKLFTSDAAGNMVYLHIDNGQVHLVQPTSADLFSPNNQIASLSAQPDLRNKYQKMRVLTLANGMPCVLALWAHTKRESRFGNKAYIKARIEIVDSSSAANQIVLKIAEGEDLSRYEELLSSSGSSFVIASDNILAAIIIYREYEEYGNGGSIEKNDILQLCNLRNGSIVDLEVKPHLHLSAFSSCRNFILGYVSVYKDASARGNPFNTVYLLDRQGKVRWSHSYRDTGIYILAVGFWAPCDDQVWVLYKRQIPGQNIQLIRDLLPVTISRQSSCLIA